MSNISLFGITVSFEMLILIGVIYLIIAINTVYGCCNINRMEGFAGANTNYGESSLYSLNDNRQINTKSWDRQSLVVNPRQRLNSSVKDILDRPKQPIPLPEGELSMFANTPFKPECCPNAYSNSSGCACMTMGQYNYLINRGGNNVPYSEY